MKKLLIILTAITLLSACGKKESVPADILSKGEMIAFLIDLHYAEAKINALSLRSDSSKQLFKVFERQLYRKYNTTDSLYLKSYNYYMENLKEMDEIYNAVVDSLSAKEKQLEAEKEKKAEAEKADNKEGEEAQ